MHRLVFNALPRFSRDSRQTIGRQDETIGIMS
jgi:hypothetical protein